MQRSSCHGVVGPLKSSNSGGVRQGRRRMSVVYYHRHRHRHHHVIVVNVDVDVALF